MMAMLGIYYTDTWGAKSQPFMSTQLRSQEGKKYPISKVFVGGVLDEAALQKYGIPQLTGSFAYALFMANAAVSFQFLELYCCSSRTNFVHRSEPSLLTPSCSGVVTSSVHTRVPKLADTMTDIMFTWQRTIKKSPGGGTWVFLSSPSSLASLLRSHRTSQCQCGLMSSL